jgi:hypothetical protein
MVGYLCCPTSFREQQVHRSGITEIFSEFNQTVAGHVVSESLYGLPLKVHVPC